MGILRLLLALAVVLDHAGPLFGLRLTGGQAAVQAFFIISGFYICFILRDKYVGPAGIRAFYVNRFFRLYPVYYLVLLFTLATPLLGQSAHDGNSLLYHWAAWYSQMSWSTVLLGVFTNAAIFFQELTSFLLFDASTGQLHWSNHHWWTEGASWYLLVIPQAWSLGIELLFYVIAPWLLARKDSVIAIVAAASLGIRILFWQYGFDDDPWEVRLFPAVLVFFCIGALVCRHYFAKVAGAKIKREKLLAVAALAYGSTIFFQFIPAFHWGTTPWVYNLIIAGSIPYLFKLTEKSRLDRYVGELSYPIYLCHFVVARMVPNHEPLPVIGWTLLFAGVLLAAVRPIEKLRAERARAVKKVRAPKRVIKASRV